MRCTCRSVAPWLAILLGVLLRMTQMTLPDLSTDEAQFALSASAAQPPLGMMYLRMAQMLFGADILVVRGAVVVLGILTLPVIYFIAREILDRENALLATALASVFPGHVLFSKLAYLSVPLFLMWALTLLMFLRVRRNANPWWLIALYIVSLTATFTKTQGILLPALLLGGRIFELRGRCIRDALCWVLGFSMIPILLYIATHPGIPATLLLYGGSMYGLSGIFARCLELVNVWWSLLFLFFVAAAVSVVELPRLPWPVWILLLLGTGIGLLLGPSHAYYTTHLVLWSVPIAALLGTLPPAARTTVLLTLTLSTLLVLSPVQNPWTYDLYRNNNYWNTHAAEMNAALAGEESIIVLGSAGHHVRWYLEPRVLIGNTFDTNHIQGTYLLLDQERRGEFPHARILYRDEEVTILKTQ